MKRRWGGFPVAVWILVGLLGIAAAMLSLGQQETQTRPSADSFGPSGTAAFAEVLRRQGYRVRIDRSPRPKLRTDETAIAFEVWNELNYSPESSDNEFSKGMMESLKTQGGRVLLLTVPSNFQSESKSLLQARPAQLNVKGRTEKIEVLQSPTASVTHTVSKDDWETSSENMATYPSVSLWVSSSDEAVRAYQVGKGRLVRAWSGSFLTNRFIDRAEDAKAAVGLVGLLAKPGEGIVFTEASFGNVENPGLMETIGPWANAAWQQFLFLGLVIVYTLGKPFGLPEAARVSQRGARELLEALADTLTRGRQTKTAMAASLDRIDSDLRMALRLPRDASRIERDRHLPDELVTALARLQAASEMEARTSPADAFNLVFRAREASDAFIGEKRVRQASRAPGKI